MQIIFILCQHEVLRLKRDLHLYKASLALENLIYAYSLMYTFTNLTIRMQIFMNKKYLHIDAVRLCSCGNKISCKDTHTHQVCSACLGLKHAQMAIENPGSCEHCVQ